MTPTAIKAGAQPSPSPLGSGTLIGESAAKVKKGQPSLNANENARQAPRIAHALKGPVTELLE